MNAENPAFEADERGPGIVSADYRGRAPPPLLPRQGPGYLEDSWYHQQHQLRESNAAHAPTAQAQIFW
jgi:hypothetical protein